MKVVFQAFHWESRKQSLLKDFFQQIVVDNTHDYNSKEKDKKSKKIFFVDNNDYILGLVLSIKDMKNFVTLDRQGKKVKVNTLKDNEQVADFNFFIISKKKHIGLYLYYHQSCSLIDFNNIMRRYYRNFIKTKNQKTGNENNEYKGTLKTTILIRQGSLNERIAKLQSVKKAIIEFSEIRCNGEFSPLQTQLKNIQYVLRFDRKSLITPIISFFKNNIFKKARIEGIDEYGHEVIYKMLNDYDIYGSYDYEDIVKHLEIDLKDFQNSITNNKIIGYLRDKLQELEKLF